MSFRSISAAAMLAALLTGCGGVGRSASPTAAAVSVTTATTRSGSVTTAAAVAGTPADTTSGTSTPARKPPKRTLVNHRPAALTSHWQVISTIGNTPALWIEQRSGVTLVRISQTLAHLALHAGSTDPGGSGWRYGDQVAGRELSHLILGFNGGFKFSTGAGGFFSFGRTAVPLAAGRASIVTYRGGRTDIGLWRQGVPARGMPVASVRQNLSLLVDGGQVTASARSCGSACWGATIGGASVVARSGLGIQRNGRLIWAAGADLSVSQLADAMAGVGVRRGMELDINPDWVAGYLYVHHRQAGLDPVPVVPGQFGIYGHLLAPYSRDFFAVLAN